MSVFIPLIPEGPSYQLLPSPPKDLTLPALYIPTFVRQGRRDISFPSDETDRRRNWKIPCLGGLCFFPDGLKGERDEPFSRADWDPYALEKSASLPCQPLSALKIHYFKC